MNYSQAELQSLGFGALGVDVAIHRSVVFFNPQNIFIGSRVRIDCFSLLSPGTEGIHIGNNIHLAVSTLFFGSGGRITLEDFCNLSSRISFYTSSDDYTEGHMTNPTIPDKYKKVERGPITLRKHAIIGCGSVIMPNVCLGIGASVGALSFVRNNVDDFQIVGGVPARPIGIRSRKLLELERLYLEETVADRSANS